MRDPIDRRTGEPVALLCDDANRALRYGDPDAAELAERVARHFEVVGLHERAGEWHEQAEAARLKRGAP